MTARELNRATLARQGLLSPIRRTPVAEAVERLGSLQAQHPEWPPIALAARAGDRRTADLAGALDRREVVRASLMRITIHVVSAADLWPMFAACRPLRLAQWRLLMKADPVDSPLGRRMTAAHRIAIDALRERPRSSLELDRMMAAEIGPDATSVVRPGWREPGLRVVVRAAWRHFSAFVPLVHVPHANEGYGRSLYALAEDWLQARQPELDMADAQRAIARRYLAAFGPATVQDLAAYVGRGRRGVIPWSVAITALGDDVVTLADDAGHRLFDLAAAPRPGADASAPPRLLARWDSLLLSHESKARERVLDPAKRSAVFSKNADILPTFLLDGFVAGTWALARSDGTAQITLRPFGPLQRATREPLLAEAERVLRLIAPATKDRSVVVAA